jgi:uncharacterized protein (TIGR02284 family)
MAGSETQLLAAANRLILVCWDCESTLSTAADVAESCTARDWYRGRAAAWARFRMELEDAVEGLGGRPLRRPGVAGTLRRALIKIQSGVGDPQTIAAECTRYEAEALRRCVQMAKEVPAAVRPIVARFCEQTPHQRLRL